MADINRRAIFIERPLDAIHYASHAGAKPAGLRQKNFQGATIKIKHVAPYSLLFRSALFRSAFRQSSQIFAATSLPGIIPVLTPASPSPYLSFSIMVYGGNDPVGTILRHRRYG